MPNKLTGARSRLPKVKRIVAKAVPIKDFRLIQRLKKLVAAYAHEVDGAELATGSKTMYIELAECFVRWLGGEFHPGVHGVNHSGRQSTKKFGWTESQEHTQEKKAP
jgi:hypothetical protein